MNSFPETSKYWRQSLLLLICAMLLSASAQADPSGRIGRIAWLSGAVQLHTANPQQSENAELNRPLTSGDILSTSAGARAEIHIGSLKLRLDSNSVLELVQVDDERIRLHLTDGSLIARLPSQESAREFELDTRNGQFTALGAGHYRFDFDGASSSATAYSGTLHFDAEDSALDIPSGQRAQFWNDGGTRYRLSSPARDDFVSWSASRDQRQTSGAYARHVSPEMTGADDLDAYGNWSETSEYGSIWYPRTVATDWAPYRHGRWVWIAPWGWNWVGNEPWGFAPFHYGRWVWHRHAWGWVPGSRIARPVYAPALVAWIGTPNFNIAISSRTSPTGGWFPLAPREVYIPAYRSSPSYVRKVNVTHVTHITNLKTIVNNPQRAIEGAHYTNRKLPQAVTTAPSDSRATRSAAMARPTPQRISESAPEQHTSQRREMPTPQLRSDRRIERAESVTATGQHSTPRAAAEIRAPAAPVAENRQAPRSERVRPESVQPSAQTRQERPQRREEQRAAPRQMQQEVHQQAPRENSRPPERNADSRKEQREAHRQPARNEKNQQDAGRTPDETRRR